MKAQSSIGRWACCGLALCLLCTPTIGCAQDKHPTSVKSTDQFVEVSTQMEILRANANALGKDVQQVRSELHETHTQLQAQIGDQIKSVTETARNHIAYATYILGSFLTALAIIMTLYAFRVKEELSELKEEVKQTLNQQVLRVEAEFVDFKAKMERELLMVEKQHVMFKEHRTEIERAISEDIKRNFEPPERLKLYVLSLLLYSEAPEDLLRRVKKEMGRLSGYQPQNHNQTEETKET